jgi:hypothetical protein
MSRAPRLCAYCAQPAEGRYGVHRDGYGVGPLMDLCTACGAHDTPTLADIWDRIAKPSVHPDAYRRLEVPTEAASAEVRP